MIEKPQTRIDRTEHGDMEGVVDAIGKAPEFWIAAIGFARPSWGHRHTSQGQGSSTIDFHYRGSLSAQPLTLPLGLNSRGSGGLEVGAWVWVQPELSCFNRDHRVIAGLLNDLI
jgi:hypothetical protein